jgi:hypothetical protein
MRSVILSRTFVISTLAIALGLGTVGVTPATAKSPYEIDGVFVEGCSCGLPCPCELVGVKMGCQGVGAMTVSRGTFGGADLSGTKIAYAVAPTQWVHLYVDAPEAAKRDAALAFARTYFGPWGKIEGERDAKIDILGDNGKFSVSVDGGKTFALSTEPVLGGDGKTPVSFSNTLSALNRTFMQGRTVRLQYQDGGHAFKLEKTNSFFNDKMSAKGEM